MLDGGFMPNMFSSVFSFLTIIPSGSHTLEDTAKNMHAYAHNTSPYTRQPGALP